MRATDLEDLFERYRRAGDAGALEQVFDRTAPEVLRIALHLVGDAEQAEELVQATFLAAIENAASFDRSRRLVPWLLGILANRVRRAREAAARSPEPWRLRQPEALDPARESERREVRPVVERALERVPDPYREVLSAHLVDGKRAIEIARGVAARPGHRAHADPARHGAPAPRFARGLGDRRRRRPGCPARAGGRQGGRARTRGPRGFLSRVSPLRSSSEASPCRSRPSLSPWGPPRPCSVPGWS